MSNSITLKKSAVTGKIPTSEQLAVGELAVNLADAKLYTKNADDQIIELTGPGSSFSMDDLHPHLYFQTLSSTSVTYTLTDDIDTITYSTGNKQIYVYDVDNLLSEIQYYGTDGTTMIAKNTLTYDANDRVTSNSWTLY